MVYMRVIIRVNRDDIFHVQSTPGPTSRQQKLSFICQCCKQKFIKHCISVLHVQPNLENILYKHIIVISIGDSNSRYQREENVISKTVGFLVAFYHSRKITINTVAKGGSQ
jgi:hypothetical protein